MNKNPCGGISRSAYRGYRVARDEFSRKGEMKKQFSKSASSEEGRGRARKRREGEAREKMYLVQCIAWALHRSHVREGRKIRERRCREERECVYTIYDRERRICSRFVCVVHERSGEPLWPYSKRATSLRLEECGNRLSRSCISILPSNTGRTLIYTRTYIYSDRATFTNARLAPRYLSLSLYLGRTHTSRTNDTASYNTRASNIIGPILPPREINVSS